MQLNKRHSRISERNHWTRQTYRKWRGISYFAIGNIIWGDSLIPTISATPWSKERFIKLKSTAAAHTIRFTDLHDTVKRYNLLRRPCSLGSHQRRFRKKLPYYYSIQPTHTRRNTDLFPDNELSFFLLIVPPIIWTVQWIKTLYSQIWTESACKNNYQSKFNRTTAFLIWLNVSMKSGKRGFHFIDLMNGSSSCLVQGSSTYSLFRDTCIKIIGLSYNPGLQ